MHDITIVEVLQPVDQLSAVKLDFSLVEFLSLLEDLVERATPYEGHHEVEPFLS